MTVQTSARALVEFKGAALTSLGGAERVAFERRSDGVIVLAGTNAEVDNARKLSRRAGRSSASVTLPKDMTAELGINGAYRLALTLGKTDEGFRVYTLRPVADNANVKAYQKA